MKVYQWTFKGRTGTVNASNTKEAKTMLAGLLRAKGDKSTRVPKGTKIKKIGLTKDTKPAVVAMKVEPVAKPQVPEKSARCNQVSEVKYEKLTKNTTFTNCVIQFADGKQSYIGEGCELIVPKGVECCKTVAW